MNDRAYGEVPLASSAGSAGIPTGNTDRAFRDVVVELWQNTEKLLRQEMALASAELDLKAQKLKTDLGAMALGGAILHTALLALMAAVILLLAEFMEPWIAALVVAVVAGVSGYMLINKHRHVSSDDVVPKRAIHSMNQDVKTFREALK